MAHVLVFYDDYLPIRKLLESVCQDEGHTVTSVETADDALMVLRTSLHPLVAVLGPVDYWPEWRSPFSYLQTVRDHPDDYQGHRDIALCVLPWYPDEQALLRSLNVSVLGRPFAFEDLLPLI